MTNSASLLLTILIAANPQTEPQAGSPDIPRLITSDVLKSTHISPDGRVQVVLQDEGKFEILDTQHGRRIASGKVLHEYVDTNGVQKIWRHLSTVAFAPAGHRMALLNPGGTIEIRDWRTADSLDSRRIPVQIVEVLGIGTDSIVITPDGKSVVWYNPDLGDLRDPNDESWGLGALIEIRAGDRPREFRGLVSAVALDDGTLLGAIQNESKKTLQIYDLKADQPKQDLEGPHHRIHQGQFSADGSLFAGAALGRVTLWDAKSGKKTFQWTGPNSETFEHGGMVFASDGKERVLLATSFIFQPVNGLVGWLRAWRSSDGQILWEREIADDIPSAPVILPDGRRFAYQLRDKSIEVRSVATGEPASDQ